MVAIDDIIRREVNPFDPTTFKPGNFWKDKQDAALTVESIHQEAIAEIEALLDQVGKDHYSRTVLLTGDSGSGKSYLLGRLKRTLNPKAFFAYIGPWPDSDYIRRHILRYSVDSLTQISEGQQESQLMLWLKSLSAFTKRTLKQRVFDDNVWELLRSNRSKFIKHLKDTYKQSGIYNADSFFGVLHDLTDPELYPLACEWLRGDDLSEESLKALKVKRSIETEEAAWETLSNLGRISTETQPIVLCFDNLDNIPRTSDGFLDFQSLFNVNTTIHNDSLNNFLVVISLITDYWKHNAARIQQADKARIEQEVHLKDITLEQAEAIWATRLQPIHLQANPKPNSSIFPLTRQALEIKFPGGKTDPRNALILARQEYQRYKNSLIITPKPSQPDPVTPPPPPPPPIEAEFQLLWQDEYKKIQGRISKISLLAATELIVMLEEALSALQVKEIKPKLLSGKYTSYSFSYKQPGKQTQFGVVWTEDSSMNSFYAVMNACQGVINKNSCQSLYLIRAATVGNTKLAGNQIYRQIFTGSAHRHIKPSLSSVHYLATYHNLVNAVRGNELVVAGKTINLEELEELICETEILDKCPLLQDLGVVSNTHSNGGQTKVEDESQAIKEFLLNLVKTQSFMGRSILSQNTLSQFSEVNELQVEKLIEQMIWENKIKVVNPKATPKDQLVCFVPKS